MNTATVVHQLPLLISGLITLGAGLLFTLKPSRRSAFFRAINPSLPPSLAGKLSRGLLAAGILFMLIFLIEVFPYPHSRPYWIVALSLALYPISTLGLAAIFLAAIFKRKP